MIDPILRDRLAAADDDLASVTSATKAMEDALVGSRSVSIGLSGNVTLDLLGTFLRKHAALEGQVAEVRIGAFDDHIGGVRELVEGGLDVLLVLDLFDALMPGFESRVDSITDDVLRDRLDAYRAELDITLDVAGDVPRVFVGLMHALEPPGTAGRTDRRTECLQAVDRTIVEAAASHPNVELIDTGAICARIGWAAAHDPRSYRRFRAPFTPAFADAIASVLARRTRGFGAYFLKALVVDGDGTLWGGTLGEDLLAGIRLGPSRSPDSIFWEIQHRLLSMRRRGVLLVLCSKNEPGDVDAALAEHPGMVLRDEDFAIKRVDWQDKPSNLRAIASTLGIGLDALVFLDDSPFEIEAVRSQLPMVRTFLVPPDLSRYPALISEIRGLFAVDSLSAEAAGKTEQYRIRSLAEAERSRFGSQEDYLASLGIRVSVSRDQQASAARIAELTQKTNQFNLTTRRRTETEVRALMLDPDHEVYGLTVSDRFGDSGLTGAAIVRYHGQDASIDTFLMSCRVLGRGVELAVWNLLLDAIRERATGILHADYVPTPKNGQVEGFWDRIGFTRRSETEDGATSFALGLDPPPILAPPPYVEVISDL